MKSPGKRLEVGVRTETGQYREHNEDRVFSDVELGLFIVADGIGGSQAGETASAMAVAIIPATIKERLKTEPPARESSKRRGRSRTRRRPQKGPQLGDPQDAAVRAIQQAVLDANRAILDLALQHREFQGMGTTVVLALVQAGTIYVTGVGDSRAHWIRRERIRQLTTDHTLAESLVDVGTLSPDRARLYGFRNVLWKYLGSDRVRDVPEVVVVHQQRGDRFLLSSDGLTNVVSEAEIVRVISRHTEAQKAADSLVQQAINSGSRDDVSCITVYVA